MEVALAAVEWGWRERRRDDDKINEEIEDEKTSINNPASIYSPLFCSASNYDSTTH